MSLAIVKSVITQFLQQKDPHVIAIKGAWGVGKTHMWTHLLEQNRATVLPAKYAYVSLFGISSLTQLRTAIFAKAIATHQIGQTLSFENINENWSAITKHGLKRLANFGTQVFSGSRSGKTISVGLETIAPFLINDTLICLDDFERLPSGGISYEELLGYITELREEKNCKVVLIFNHDKLADLATYERYREKVIDIELLYEPTSEEAMELVLPDTLPLIDEIKKYCETLKIKNIRVLKKILTLINDIHPRVKHLHPRVYQQAVHTGIAFSWSYFGNEPDIPPISFLKNWNSLTYQINLRDDPGAEVDQRWVNTLNIYGIFNVDEFDLLIFETIKKGFIEESAFSDAVNERDARCLEEDLDQSFSDAWKLYHNTFADNEEELVTALITSVKQALIHVSPMNLSGTTMLLRYLEREKEADELVELYVDAWIKAGKKIDFKNHPFAADIKDPLILQLFDTRAKELEAILPLNTFTDSIIQGTLSSNELRSLTAASVENYVELFKQNNGEALASLISACLRYSQYQPELRIIGQNAHAALVRIGNENRLNAKRIVRYNVNIDQH